MQVIKINKCPDHSKWYKPYIGCLVPLLRPLYIHEYKSVEMAGFVNFISKLDGEAIEVPVGTPLYVPYI